MNEKTPASPWLEMLRIFTGRFRIATDKEKTEAVARLVKASTGDFDFCLFVVLGVTTATLGLLLDSPEVIIGGMLIAPVLYPLLSFSLAATLWDFMLLRRSAVTLGISLAVSIGIALLFTLGMAPFGLHISTQIVARAEPNALYFLVAFVSGFAAAYALIHAELNELLPGVAISVSLVPPVAVVGIGLGLAKWTLAGGALLLFVLNAFGIILASIIVFTLSDLHRTHRVAESAVYQEDRRIEKEHEKIDQVVHENVP